jgi:hypothetical protein
MEQTEGQMRFKFVAITVLFFSSIGASAVDPPDKFWISFVSHKSLRSTRNLMQIDLFGTVLLPPMKIDQLGHVHLTHPTALSFNGPDRLNFWVGPHPMSRFIINKTTLKTIRQVQTKLDRFDADSFLAVTHRKSDNFIAFDVPTDDGIRLAAYPLDSGGKVIGKSWFLSPPFSPVCETFLCGGGVAPNGRVAFWADFDHKRASRNELFVRLLGSRGRPVGDPIFIEEVTTKVAFAPAHYNDADVSSVLPEGLRYVVYIRVPHTEEERPDSLRLQKIDASTGAKIGDPIILTKDLDLGDVKVDPKGRFVLFTDHSDGGVLANGLYYLALDATGHPSGKPRPIVLGNLGFIDLLPDQ